MKQQFELLGRLAFLIHTLSASIERFWLRGKILPATFLSPPPPFFSLCAKYLRIQLDLQLFCSAVLIKQYTLYELLHFIFILFYIFPHIIWQHIQAGSEADCPCP